jgi:hypothetical protein
MFLIIMHHYLHSVLKLKFLIALSFQSELKNSYEIKENNLHNDFYSLEVSYPNNSFP